MDANLYTKTLGDELLKSLEYYNHKIEDFQQDVMTCLGQVSGHEQLAAVMTDILWELGMTSLGRYYY